MGFTCIDPLRKKTGPRIKVKQLHLFSLTKKKKKNYKIYQDNDYGEN